MKCYCPIKVKNKNYGRINFYTKEVEPSYKEAPCGRCYSCLQRKRSGWFFRLQKEHKKSSSAYFITLTYDDENCPDYVNKRDVQLFMKILRQNEINNIRYYLVAEYGTKTHRPHYHAIIFNLSGKKEEVIEKVFQSWKKGHVRVDVLNPARVAYCAGYTTKMPGFENDDGRCFTLMSRRPGIGASYLDTHSNYHRDNLIGYVSEYSVKYAMPRYFKDKLFDEKDKHRLEMQYWQEKHDEFKYNALKDIQSFEYQDSVLKKRLIKNRKL